MKDVPYISQLGNAPNNDCGPACALMLARAAGNGLTETVEHWSKQLPRGIDAEDDGTTATELAGMLEKLGCTPVICRTRPIHTSRLWIMRRCRSSNATTRAGGRLGTGLCA